MASKKMASKKNEQNTSLQPATPAVVFDVNSHREAVALGLELQKARDIARKQAGSLLQGDDAPWRIRDIVTWMDSVAFSACADMRQINAHTAVVRLLQHLDAWVYALTHAAELRDADADDDEVARAYEQAAFVELDVHNALVVLGQRAPKAVRKQEEMSLALRGYLAMLSGLRTVNYTAKAAPKEKVQAALAAQEKREAQAEAARMAIKQRLAANRAALGAALD